MKIKAVFKKIFLGSESNEFYKSNPFYEKQRKNLSDIWNNKTYNDFGIERLLRLLLQLTAFIIPSSIVRALSGSSNLLYRKLSIELWGLFKIVFIIVVIENDYTRSLFVLVVAIILSIDTLHFLVSRIFLDDVFRQAISYKRSLLMTFLNYIEICMCFALIYAFIDHTSAPCTIFEKVDHITNLQAIYFSFVTSTTIGYGDITPKDTFVMKIVIGQILVSLFLVVVIIANAINKIEGKTFYNQRKKRIKR